MSFYLKKTRLKNRTYLSIDESFYSPEKKGTAHRCYQSLGSVETHIKNGIEDPIAYFQKQVDELNQVRKKEKTLKIGDVSPLLNLGYFPLASILNKLGVRKYIDLFHLANEMQFDLYELMSTLIYARAVHPCSKNKTFQEVIPSLLTHCGFSYDQLLDGLSFLGANYQKFVEIFTEQTNEVFGSDTTTTYFDCTNFFFEIDREDDFRRNGPSKENRKTPIVGLGLLTDSNQIPIGMKMYPGNESEKPVMRDVMDELKKSRDIDGRTIHVADKGLNCAANIAHAKQNGDGYIFSKSVKTLPEMEKTWVLLDADYQEVRDKKGNTLYLYKSCVDEFPYVFQLDGKSVSVTLKEKRLVTYNPSLAAKKRYEICRMVEKAKALTLSGAKKHEFGEAGKYIQYTDKDGKKASVCINEPAIKKDLLLAGYNLLVTSEIDMPDRQIYDTYHNLWRIEESFRIMKSDLDARPVFLQKKETIQGHFLICYLTVLLERLLQVKVLENRFSAGEIFDFFRKFRVARVGNKYLNVATRTDLIEKLEEIFGVPLTNYFLKESQIRAITNCKI